MMYQKTDNQDVSEQKLYTPLNGMSFLKSTNSKESVDFKKLIFWLSLYITLIIVALVIQ